MAGIVVQSPNFPKSGQRYYFPYDEESLDYFQGRDLAENQAKQMGIDINDREKWYVSCDCSKCR